ncbi:hypothetical protein D3C86_1452560 [compost metagenome]
MACFAVNGFAHQGEALIIMEQFFVYIIALKLCLGNLGAGCSHPVFISTHSIILSSQLSIDHTVCICNTSIHGASGIFDLYFYAA